MPALSIEPVEHPRLSSDFVELPWRLNADDPDWVAPLRMALNKLLDRNHYPFYKYGDAAFFVARRGKEVVGRIAAIENRLHAEKYKDGVGFFGFFECEDDVQACRALLQEASRWLKDKGYASIRGPVNYSLNDECPGVLYEGFNGIPLLLMAHNPRYYARLLNDAGMSKCMDLYAYLVTRNTMADERFARVMQAVRRRAPKVELRQVRTSGKGFREDIESMLDIFNQAWRENWGFVDVTPPEVDVIAADLKPIVRPELTSIATFEGKPIGMMVCVPNVNEILHDIPDGKLWPNGWWKLLWRMKNIRGFRTMLMGVTPEYRNRGIDALMIDQIISNGRKAGFLYCELSWVLENNEGMNSLAQKAGGNLYRKYRLFEATNDRILQP
jgi:GNAT superfamily N-acetyltransferase